MKTGTFAAILAALLMATLGIFAKKTALDPRLLTFCRFAIGGGLLGLTLLLSGRGAALCHRPELQAVTGGIFLATFAAAYFIALQHTSLANAVTLLYLGPPIASIFAHVLFRERLDKINVVLIILAVLGFAMLLEFRFDLADQGGFGICCGLVSGLGYAAFIVNNRVQSKMTAEVRTFTQLAVAALCLSPFAAATGRSLIDADPQLWLWLIALGLLPGFLGLYAVVFALERIPTAVFATLSYLEPIFVVLFGWLLFGETLGALQATGIALVLISGLITGILSTG